MDQSELYKLSKDLLVKLISTIQHDLKNEITTYKNIVNCINKESSCVQVAKCSFMGCHRYWFFEEGYEFNEHTCNEVLSDTRLIICQCHVTNCDCIQLADKGIGWWCSEHLPSYIKRYGGGGTGLYICDTCIDEKHYWTSTNDFFEDGLD